MKVPRPPEVNIGMVGHVDHGKSTLTKLITGVKTDYFSEEIKRGISIKLGYADAPIYRCKGNGGPSYVTNPSDCNGETELERVVSFVDSPGHETLMATMLSGAAIMDGALMVIASNEKCPQPQTREHLMALNLLGIRNIVIVQNKIDLVTEERALESYNEIKEFVKGTVAENAPIIPMSAIDYANLDALLYSIEKFIPTKNFNKEASPMMYIARSFDVNKPGTLPKDLQGGVVGGSIFQGTFRVGDQIEISPGTSVSKGGKKNWTPILTEATSIISGSLNLKEKGPGGLVGIGTKLDPFMTKGDSLVGMLVGIKGTIPKPLFSLTLKTSILEKVVGSSQEMKVDKISNKETLLLNVATAVTVAVVTSVKGDIVEVELKYPVIALPGQNLAISRKILNRWRLIGSGIVH
ncbi:MAG: translation initiation factor IF-2 subunit gamma [Candidatus Thermoplasmatota archaeon]|jgi:translation initiation factor 2 subunit 3|nr:translation initiation factor IF-2 subunit gamma [Candidatus Thermoplasmatota archaeon]